jgi:hypothetical protein
VIIPPLVFVAEILLVLTLAAGAAAVWLGFSSDAVRSLRRAVRAFLRPRLRSQHDIALSLGLSLRAWVALRVVAGLTGLVASSITGLWTITVAGTLLAVFGLPWLLAGRAAKRRLRMERALATLALSVRNLMQQSNLLPNWPTCSPRSRATCPWRRRWSTSLAAHGRRSATCW